MSSAAANTNSSATSSFPERWLLSIFEIATRVQNAARFTMPSPSTTEARLNGVEAVIKPRYTDWGAVWSGS